jgi:adenosine kinase
MQSSPYVPKYIAGGSSQNSVRVAQWMLGEENKTSFAGVVGDDDEGRKLTKVARDDGVNVFYSLSAKKLPTGVCGVLVHEHDRSMVTNLQAASDFSLHNLEESKHLWQNAQFMIVEGYFLNVCEESIIALGNHQLKNDRLFAFSLSAPFICEFRTKGVQNVIENSNLIIGNESEAVAFSNAMGWGLGDDDHDAIAKKIALLPFSSNLPETDTPRTRKVIITRGGSDIVISDGVQSAFYPVTPMKVEDMVDANGAGDAFCGGFLAALMKGKDDASAVQAGIFAAQIILKTSGTELEGKSANYQW